MNVFDLSFIRRLPPSSEQLPMSRKDHSSFRRLIWNFFVYGCMHPISKYTACQGDSGHDSAHNCSFPQHSRNFPLERFSASNVSRKDHSSFRRLIWNFFVYGCMHPISKYTACQGDSGHDSAHNYCSFPQHSWNFPLERFSASNVHSSFRRTRGGGGGGSEDDDIIGMYLLPQFASFVRSFVRSFVSGVCVGWSLAGRRFLLRWDLARNGGALGCFVRRNVRNYLWWVG